MRALPLSFTKGITLKTIVVPTAENQPEVVIKVTNQGGLADVPNDQFYEWTKLLLSGLDHLPSGVMDRLLWLLLSREVNHYRQFGNREDSDKLYAAWELLNKRVTPGS